MAPALKPFQLLEINIISAQDLEPVSKKMRTYATAWMNQNRKLSTCVDAEGKHNPTWNDKFVFRVDDEFLRRDTSSVMIEIYAVNWFRDTLVGTVRVLVGNLIPPPVRSNNNQSQQHIGMRFVALQVRRPSGRPQGILNIGVALLDGSMRSMPLYTQVATSAVGYRDLMEDPPNLHQPNENEKQNNNNSNNNNSQPLNVKPILRRTRSERSEHLALDKYSPPNSSIVAAPAKTGPKESSILSISESMEPFKGMIMMKKKGKASSVISGEKPKQKGTKTKGSSVLSDSILSKGSSSFHKIEKNEIKRKPLKIENKQTIVVKKANSPKDKGRISKYIEPKYTVNPPPLKGNSLWSDSEVGPSPSEVAAAMVAERKYPLNDNQSSVLDGWSVDESVEGLRSKLERWRTELPPLYDRSRYSPSSYKSSVQPRRHSGGGGGSGLFSCFGNICGYECQCVCGKPPGKRSVSGRFMSPSFTPGRSFV